MGNLCKITFVIYQFAKYNEEASNLESNVRLSTGLVDDDGCHQIFISNENKKRSRYLRCGHQETTKLEQIHSGLQRKITMIGSDGKHYVMMSKPKDDLRKDCSLMEFNAIINKFQKEVFAHQNL